MSARVQHYFVNGNTAQGYMDYFSSNLQNLEKIYILKGGPGTGKSTLIQSIFESYKEKDGNIECIHSPLDPNSLDGIILPDLKAAVIDGTEPHKIELKAPGAIEEEVNLGSAWDSTQLKEHKNEILLLTVKIKDSITNAYKSFAEALKIHDEWEKFYIKNMDFTKADKLIKETIERILGDNRFEKSPKLKHRFFGASTPLGPKDYIENLTSNMEKRYFLKGRPGTGKSTLLKQLLSACIERGFDAEIYHCGFDSNSLDMILLPEINACIFDSTSPHLYEPSKPTDEIIDMYSSCVKPGTDEKYMQEIQGTSARYKIAVQRGMNSLAETKTLRDELKKIYINAMDFEKVNLMREDVLEKIDSLQ